MTYIWKFEVPKIAIHHFFLVCNTKSTYKTTVHAFKHLSFFILKPSSKLEGAQTMTTLVLNSHLKYFYISESQH